MTASMAPTAGRDTRHPGTSGGTGFEIGENPDGHHQVRLWGYFPPGWLAAFATGMAKSGISIVDGTAKKVSAARWEATFTLDVPRHALDPHRIDFVELVKKQAETVQLPAIRLDDLLVEHESDGTLRIDLKGADQPGFLMVILRNFAFYSIFPAEVSIRTVDNQVRDSFWLRGIGNSALPAETVQAVREKLLGYLVRATHSQQR